VLAEISLVKDVSQTYNQMVFEESFSIRLYWFFRVIEPGSRIKSQEDVDDITSSNYRFWWFWPRGSGCD
jgi:hypothetical protein